MAHMIISHPLFHAGPRLGKRQASISRKDSVQLNE